MFGAGMVTITQWAGDTRQWFAWWATYLVLVSETDLDEEGPDERYEQLRNCALLATEIVQVGEDIRRMTEGE